MAKTHEYLGTKATSLHPYGHRKEIALYIKEKSGGRFLVERHNEYYNRSTKSWKTKQELKDAIRKLDSITEKGLSHIGLDVNHCPKGFRKSDAVAVYTCVRESADKYYPFRR